MNIFLGSIYPRFLLEGLMSREQYVDYPANIFQQSLLKGLDEHYPDLRVVSSPVIHSSYAKVKDLCKRYRFSHKNEEGRDDIYVGTLPIPGMQMISELWRVYKTIKKIIKKTNQKPILLIYALHSPFLMSAVLLKNKIGCSCVVVPDLPEYMSNKDGLARTIGKRIDRTIIDFCLRHIDGCVLLSPYMRDKLPIKDKPWVLMEGIFDTKSIPEKRTKSEERVILYGGDLSRQYGIVELLDAFRGIDKDNYRLWICGRGDGESDVVKMAAEDERIIFWGVISHDELLSLQQRATVLINPRSSAGEYTKYSFPSKTMEYLASGTPTIMCHLPAIPEEYNAHIYYVEEESVEGIRKKILEICEKPQNDLDKFGKAAAEFIKNEKNAFVQSKKVVEMIDKIINN